MRAAEQDGRLETPPCAMDVQKIIGFAQSLPGNVPADGIVLCHCTAGISRSAAAGLICLATWRGPGAEADCVAEVIRIRRAAAPHADLVRLRR